VKEVNEGDKKTIWVQWKRNWGSGAFVVTNPERRIVKSDLTLVAGFDWAAASYDATTMKQSALFDATNAALPAGKYEMQLRAVVGPERITRRVVVTVINIGP
jgi:hypothetical protein